MEKRYTQSGDIYRKEIQDLHREKTNRVEIYTGSGDMRKENIEFIQRRDTHRIKTHTERNTQSKNTQGVEIYTRSGNTYRK